MIWLAQTKLLLLLALLSYLSLDSGVYGYNTAISRGIINISENKQIFYFYPKIELARLSETVATTYGTKLCDKPQGQEHKLLLPANFRYKVTLPLNIMCASSFNLRF
jgi:hypothetical protein